MFTAARYTNSNQWLTQVAKAMAAWVEKSHHWCFKMYFYLTWYAYLQWIAKLQGMLVQESEYSKLIWGQYNTSGLHQHTYLARNHLNLKREHRWLWRLWVMNLILSKHFSCYCHLLTYLWVDQVDQNCLDILGLSKEILLSFPFQSCYSSVFFPKDQMQVKNVTNRQISSTKC